MSNLKTIPIVLSKFPTHIQISSKKWKKIGGNLIYKGVHWTSRNNIFHKLHEYVGAHLPSDVVFKDASLKLLFRVPINWGTVKRTEAKGITWKPPKQDYIPRWDIDNLAWPWIKAIQDSLVRNGMIGEDSVAYITGNCYSYEPCKTLDDREIKIEITGHVL